MQRRFTVKIIITPANHGVSTWKRCKKTDIELLPQRKQGLGLYGIVTSFVCSTLVAGWQLSLVRSALRKTSNNGIRKSFYEFKVNFGIKFY